MSTVRVAIPVLRGKVMVLLDKGRPWSVIEHLLLEALAKRSWPAAELATYSGLPKRLVIEAVVRLMRAGWVDITPGAKTVAFRANSYGASAASMAELPNVTRKVRRPIAFIVDQVTGDIFRNREWIAHEEQTLKEREKREKIVWLRPKSLVRGFDPNRFVDTLLEDDEKFLDAEPSGLVRRFVLATVRNGAVEGLPKRQLPQLRAAVLAAAQSEPPKSTSESHTYTIDAAAMPEAERLPIQRRIAFEARDLVLDGQAHRRALEQVFRSAKSRIFVHSTFIDGERFLEWLAFMEEAAKRGVRIYVFWGQSEDKDYVTSTRAALRSLRGNPRIQSLEESLVVHPFSTMSHSKLVVADSGKGGEWIAIVGSCNWFTSGFTSYDVSIILRDPNIVADVVKHFAALSCIHNGIWTPLTSDLVALGKYLETRGSFGDPNATAALVIGAQHKLFVLKARDEAKRRIFIASHRLGAASNPVVIAPLVAAVKSRGIKADVYFNRPTGPMHSGAAESLISAAESLGVAVEPIKLPRLHAKVLAWDDDSLVVTSLNWLSGDPVDFASLKEIGVWIEAKGTGRKLIDHFEESRTAE